MVSLRLTRKVRNILLMLVLSALVLVCLLPRGFSRPAQIRSGATTPEIAPHSLERERGSTLKSLGNQGAQDDVVLKSPTRVSDTESKAKQRPSSVKDGQMAMVTIEGLYQDSENTRENATFFSLVRNSDKFGLLKSIRSVEDRFNGRYHYDWVFANDEPFTKEFIETVSSFCSGTSKFVQIPKEMWSMPKFIDQKKATKTRRAMRRKRVKYGFSESYRHMCRFNSGFFYDLPVMKDYRYYWRVEPDVDYRCDILYDPFTVLRENEKVYGFNMAPLELHTTVETLWDQVLNYQEKYPDKVAPDNNMAFLSDDDGKSFNMCHFWSNFEIADLEFFRSDKYRHFFDYLDRAGGIYYERWGDAPIHTMAVSLLLSKDKLQFFPSTGYFHEPNQDCPRAFDVRVKGRCDCSAKDEFTWGHRSCIPKFFDVHGFERPHGSSNLKYTPIHKSAEYKKERAAEEAAEAAAEAAAALSEESASTDEQSEEGGEAEVSLHSDNQSEGNDKNDDTPQNQEDRSEEHQA
ncbi:unnamed protein product [Kuraishia capsulata CBS 1993]|uniref:Glycosyltransferase family 15 protein n=1 Tax=Kuraishia capsulata CBS 1993 TaxID=1382522 RepID=W6MSE1_9ASCO|nr:uncharacterized protein KUCA_T00005714001 [Kuraishia capsulata CBS 1993]CDK29721.1 unnamed protein product [Kuraishia capsulata CBS 1993]